MTKEQFLNGDLFKVTQYGGLFKLSDDKTYIQSAFVTEDGRVVSLAYEGNVGFVGRVAVQIKRVVITKVVKLKYNYSDLIRVEIEDEVKNNKEYLERRRKREEERRGE